MVPYNAILPYSLAAAAAAAVVKLDTGARNYDRWLRLGSHFYETEGEEERGRRRGRAGSKTPNIKFTAKLTVREIKLPF